MPILIKIRMNDIKKEITKHLDIIKENAVELISEEEIIVKLEKSIQGNIPLRLKAGFDPTAKDIHLGHTVILHKLRKLQDLGDIVYFIIGDFTAKIGDPSGRTVVRPVLTDDEIKENALTYTQQAFKILDEKKTKIIYNSEWYKNLELSQFLSLLSSITLARILERDDFSQRMKENRPLTLLELIYPLIQGYDSVKIGADIEFGGTDQKFNLIVGRHLQELFGQSPQVIVTSPLLVGLDGKNKMSKSLGNYVAVTEKPKDMFGKLMSIPDNIMWEYLRLLTCHNVSELKNIHPKEAKLKLAQSIVSFYYGEKTACEEKEEFERIFSEKYLPKDITIYKTNTPRVDVLNILCDSHMVSSKNEARRLISQGGISFIDNNDSREITLKEQFINVKDCGIILKVGKKKFIKIIPS